MAFVGERRVRADGGGRGPAGAGGAECRSFARFAMLGRVWGAFAPFTLPT